MRGILSCVALACLLMVAPALRADSNLHMMDGNMVDCGCQCVPIFPPPIFAPFCDQICTARFEVGGPAPHWSEESPAVVPVELQGEAIHQCGVIHPDLPRRVQVLYWMEFGGRDFGHGGIVRTQAKAYFLVNLGPAD